MSEGQAPAAAKPPNPVLVAAGRVKETLTSIFKEVRGFAAESLYLRSRSYAVFQSKGMVGAYALKHSEGGQTNTSVDLQRKAWSELADRTAFAKPANFAEVGLETIHAFALASANVVYWGPGSSLHLGNWALASAPLVDCLSETLFSLRGSMLSISSLYCAGLVHMPRSGRCFTTCVILQATGRLRKNAAYFRVNYLIFVGLVTAICFCLHPTSLFVVGFLAMAWVYLFVVRQSPIVIGGRTFRWAHILTNCASLILLFGQERRPLS